MFEVNPQTFFPNTTREIVLDDWAPKFNRESEKRLRLDISMPLTGQAVVGMPGFLHEPFDTIAQDDACFDEIPLNPEIEGVTMEFFATPLTPRTMLLTATTLRSMRLAAKGQDEKRKVVLEFSTTVPANLGLLQWLYENHGATMFLKFDVTQASLVGPESAQMTLDQQPKLLTSDEHECDSDDPEGCTKGDHAEAHRSKARAKAENVLDGKKAKKGNAMKTHFRERTN